MTKKIGTPRNPEKKVEAEALPSTGHTDTISWQITMKRIATKAK
jgi:hypothetical protein